MKRISSSALIILTAFTFITEGCKKETTSLLSGNLFGFVTLYDQYGAKVFQGVNATNVTLNTPSASVLNTVTDTAGKFAYNNLTEGQYTINFTNAGYGSISNSPFGFLGGGNIDHDVKLSAIPNFSDSILFTPIDTLNTIVVSGILSGTDTHKRTYVVFVGSTSAVSSAPANYKTFYTSTTNANQAAFNLKIAISDLYDAGFGSGSTVYFAGYGAAADFTSSSSVEDYNTGRINFTALSAGAATTSITLP